MSADGIILAFGNSLTYGTGATPSQSYPAILQNLTQHKVINAGVPGELSEAGLRRLPALINEHKPEVLILCHGGNDMLRKLDQSETIKNVEQMIKFAQNHGISVVLIGVPKPKLLFMKSAEFYKKIAQAAAIPYQASILAEIESDRSMKSDTIHPNAAGYNRFAEAIHKLLLESGAI
jgi:acyl-CoA thioesterase-1